MYKLAVFFIFTILLSACGDKGASGVQKSLISGYDYKHFISTGGEKPKVNDFVYFDMDILNDSDSLLQTFRDQKIKPSVQILDPTDANRIKNPMVDIISLLAVGDSAAILVPSDSIDLPPGMEDVKHIEYHVVISEIISDAENTARIAAEQQKQAAQMEVERARLPEIESLTEQTLKDYKAGNLDVKETPNGVKYYIHELGAGEMPLDERMLTMSYYGRSVSTGVRFDDSFSRGRGGYAFRVGSGAVIQGWHEIARFLPVGTKASAFIPSELGYGAQGSPPSIGPNEELYFYLEPVELAY